MLEHLLLSCKLLQLERRQLKDDLGGLLIILLILMHIKIGIEKLVTFLKNTGIATRKWYLQRLEHLEIG